MFELKLNSKNQKILVFTHRPRTQRGIWVEIGLKLDPEMQHLVDLNREMGIEVELDETGKYRALVLRD